MHCRAKLHQIGQKIADKWRFNGFCKMAAVRHVRFAGGVLGPPAKITWRSLSLCKIWLSQCCGFDSMKLSHFAILA